MFKRKTVIVGLICFAAPIFFAWIAEGKMQHQDQITQEWSGDYYPPEEQ